MKIDQQVEEYSSAPQHQQQDEDKVEEEPGDDEPGAGAAGADHQENVDNEAEEVTNQNTAQHSIGLSSSHIGVNSFNIGIKD